MKKITLLLVISSISFACKKPTHSLTVEVKPGVFDKLLIIPCKKIQKENNVWTTVTTGNKPVRNMDFELVVLTGSSNIIDIKNSALFSTENVELGKFLDLLNNTDIPAPRNPDLEKEIENDYRYFFNKSNQNLETDVKVVIPYRTTGVKNFKISTLESWRGMPAGSDIVEKGGSVIGWPIQIISSETMKLLYGYSKPQDYSPLYFGLGEITEWTKLKPTIPAIITYTPSMHSEIYGDFSFVVTVKTTDDRTIADTCKVKLLSPY